MRIPQWSSVLVAVIAVLWLGQAAQAATVDVSITSGGFVPSSVDIAVGDTVRWTNDTPATRNVSSNNHPTHTLYSPLNLGNISSGGTVSLLFDTAGTYGYHDHLFSSQTGSVTVAAEGGGGGDEGDGGGDGGGGGGGGSGTTVTTTVSLARPNGGEKFVSGTEEFIFWTAEGSNLQALRLLLSTDEGATYPTVISASEFHDGAYLWLIPSIPSTTLAMVKIEALNVLGEVLASDRSADIFEIVGVQPEPTPTPSTPAEPQSTDGNTTGSYSPATATAAASSIDVDQGFMAVLPSTAPCVAGSRIKASMAAVYYCGTDGKRHAFPNEAIYFTWFADFSGITVISDAALAAVPLGSNVEFRPGIRMIKVQTDPKVYAVASGGVLRWVQTEAIARSLYGDDWNKDISDLNDAFFTSYSIGDPITE